MQIHGRAKLGPAGRLALCEAIEGGMTFRQAAACLNVSPATAHRWWHRYADALLAERHSLAWAADRSSRPHRSPRLLDAGEQAQICEVRRHTGWGPRLVAGRTGHSHSTVWKVLHRHGLSQRPRKPRDATRRYEWPCPGDLLHMDTARYARFERPGHRVTGDRSTTRARMLKPVGYDFAHAIVDDHSKARLRRAAHRRTCRDDHCIRRACSDLVCPSRDSGQAPHDGQRLELHAQPLPTRTPGRPRDQAHHHKALPPPDQREGRALPPDDGTRVGIRHELPLTPPPQPSPATLARALQHAQATLRDRQPATHQPRSQPPWAGQLATNNQRRWVASIRVIWYFMLCGVERCRGLPGRPRQVIP